MLFQAYFGGEGRCEHEHNDDFNPADLVCGGCVDISREQVRKGHEIRTTNISIINAL